MTSAKTPPSVWFGQRLHFICLVMLLALVAVAWKYLGAPFPLAFWIAVAFPVAHQVYVWLTWRLELQSHAISNTIGFGGYLVCFFLLFIGRFVSLLTLACLDRGSLGLQALPRTVLFVLLILPATYTAYSVMRYFGNVRAAGADHFDPQYRTMPWVREGIFRFTSNGMYCFAFLFFGPLLLVSIRAQRWLWQPLATLTFGFISMRPKSRIWIFFTARRS